jgi:exonuclease 3'-5' domain-containing protein 1
MATTSIENPVILVDSEASLIPLLESITSLPTDPPSLYVDLEGISLGRHGSVSILSFYVSPLKKTYLIDVYSFGAATFNTATDGGTSLKGVLESATIPKVFFDIRNKSDALFNLFQIRVDGIKDLQLMELASRGGSRQFLSDSASCIERDSQISLATKIQWNLAKELVISSCCGLPRNRVATSYDGVLNERPLRPELVQLYQQHIALLPALYKAYNDKLKLPGEAFWRVVVRGETKDRIKLSQSAEYDGNSKNLALGWDDYTMDQRIETWNDEILMEAMIGDWVLDKDDNWVEAPKDNLSDCMNEENEEDLTMAEDEDIDQTTARDCIGWEEDMIKNGEYF